MNDLDHPCEPWAEPISLAAAGCLSPDEERDVRRHIETCSDCRERFRQLTGWCGALAEAQLPADVAEAAIVERVMSAVAPGESRRPTVRTREEMIHPTLLTRSLDSWRWIMRSPVLRAAAAAIFVLAIVGAALWFYGGGTTPAFADFIEPIRNAKNAKYKITVEMEGPLVTDEVMNGSIAQIKERFSAEMEKVEKDLVARMEDRAANIEKGLSAEEKEGLFTAMKGLSAEMKERLAAEIKEGRLSAEMNEVISAEMMKGISAAWEKAEKDSIATLKKSLPEGLFEGPSVVTTEVMTQGATRRRMEHESPADKSKMVVITDQGQGKTLTLEPAKKKATVRTYVNMPKAMGPHKDKDPLAFLCARVLDGRFPDNPNFKLEPLGEKDMDGRRVVGFRLIFSSPAMVMSLWGDPETGLPVHIEWTTAELPNAKTTVSDFEFNVDMDESLFSVEPPAGYEVVEASPR